MATVLRQSTQIKVRVGPFVDVGDGFTPETGITLGAADEAEALKADGAATASIAAATWAAVTSCDGWYDLTLTTSHTDTVGELVIVVQDDSVCLPVFTRFQVIEEVPYDALYAASAAAAMALTTAERASTSDALLDRDMSTGADSGSTTVRTVRQALRFMRNRWAVATGTLTVYKEDDTTASWTSAMTTDAAANPVKESNPAGP